MSFLDPQSWDDVDGGGNPLDWSSRSQKLLYPAYEMLRRALAERYAIAGLTLTAPLTTQLLPEMLVSRRGAGKSWCENFDQALFDGLLGTANPKRYIDYIDNGGNWDGLPTTSNPPFPIWDKASILTELGESEVVAPDAGGPYSGAWSLQRYKILNLMRWTYSAADDGWISTREFYQAKGGDTWAVTWAKCTTGWLGTSWPTDIFVTLAIPQGRGIKSGFSGIGATGVRSRVKPTYKPFSTSYGMKFNVDHYFEPDPTSGGISTWDDEGLGITVGNWYRGIADDGPLTAALNVPATVYIGEDNTMVPEPPDPTPTTRNRQGWYLNATSPQVPYFVMKWNITGGLKFVA